MPAPNKEQREKCWIAKDTYWECLDKNGVEPTKCQKLREQFVGNCSNTWVKYFDRRRDYLKFKNKIENDGYEPVNQKQ